MLSVLHLLTHQVPLCSCCFLPPTVSDPASTLSLHGHRSVCGPGSRPGEDRLASARYSGSRYYVFDGGCVGYRFSFSEAGSAALTNDVSLALGFYERAQLEERVKKATGLEL